MTLYVAAPIEATRWFKNGDHPDDHVGERLVDWEKLGNLRPDICDQDGWHLDGIVIPNEAYYERGEGDVVRYFRRPEPEYRGDLIHFVCGQRFHDHGWIDCGDDGQPVCTGDWVITDSQGEYRSVKDAAFRLAYKPVVEGSAQ